MIHYLCPALSCFSTITYCMDRNTIAKIRADRQAMMRGSIQQLLEMRTGQGDIKTGSYILRNENGNFYEERENPTTGLPEERNFTLGDIASFSFDHPNWPVNIILKK